MSETRKEKTGDPSTPRETPAATASSATKDAAPTRLFGKYRIPAQGCGRDLGKIRDEDWDCRLSLSETKALEDQRPLPLRRQKEPLLSQPCGQVEFGLRMRGRRQSSMFPLSSLLPPPPPRRGQN
jgi:hypothetical protein